MKPRSTGQLHVDGIVMLTFRVSRPPLLACVGISYIYGLVLGSIWLVWNWLSGSGVPDLEWWHLGFGPLMLGGIAFALEAAGNYLASAFGEGQSDQPRWKHAVALVALFLFMAVFLVGPAFYQLSSK